jgi:hypothetical protein
MVSVVVVCATAIIVSDEVIVPQQVVVIVVAIVHISIPCSNGGEIGCVGYSFLDFVVVVILFVLGAAVFVLNCMYVLNLSFKFQLFENILKKQN